MINQLSNQKKDGDSPAVSVQTSGENAHAISIGGNQNTANIVINPKEAQAIGASAEARRIANEIMITAEERKAKLPAHQGPRLPVQPPLIEMFAEILRADPYATKALLLRGQSYSLNAKNFGLPYFREAFNDYESALKTDKSLADPHFGLGTVMYSMAIFDIYVRGRYVIHAPGQLQIDSESAQSRFKPPQMEMYIDARSKTILQGALDEFEAGRRLQQVHHREGNATVVLFAPQDIEKRTRSIRSILGYEPQFLGDFELVQYLASYTAAFGDGRFDGVLRMSPATANIRAPMASQK